MPSRGASGHCPKAAAGKGAAPPPIAEGGGVVDLEEAARARAARREACAVPFQIKTKLVAYDKSTPAIAIGPLGKVCGEQLSDWLHGRLSGEMACLYVDEWAQGEVTWTDAQGGALQRRLGIMAGMLADASLDRAFAAELHGAVFARQPEEVGRAAAKKVLDSVQDPEAETVLVSEVEHALTRLESYAYGDGPAKRLEAAVHRELLRLLWTDAPKEAADFRLTDRWLLGELSKQPQGVFESAKAAGTARLRQENQALDVYLVRLLKLKRALAALLDEWEKVDHYAIIGVPPTATDKELRNAYRKACLRLHPDKGGDKAQFQQLQDAYAKILEERSQQPQASSGTVQAEQKAGTSGQSSAAPGASAASSGGPDGQQLAIEGPAAGAPVATDDAAVAAAISEVVEAERQLREQAEASQHRVAEAERAEAKIRQLKQAKEGGVDALKAAQEAGEALMRLSEELGESVPKLSEAAMEVAESSLACAARFSSVPAAMLLTDVALSCTFEASRMQHTAGQLLEVHRDTVSTLMTLQTNLSMAKIIGNVDAETLKLSLGLVTKAASRIIVALRQVGCALDGALQRGRQCIAQARSVAAFAAGREAADAADAEDEGARAALPAPEGCQWDPSPPPGDQGEPAETGARPEASSPPEAGGPAPEPSAAPPPPAASAASREAAAIEARLQNDKLLRQLNGDLLELQRRARSHLAKRGGPQALAEISAEARARVLQLAAEALDAATDAASSEFTPVVDALEEVLARHFGFVEAAGGELAMPYDLRAQVLRLAVLVDTQAVLSALQKQAKSRLVSRCEPLAEDERGLVLAVIDRRFESMSNTIVAARMA